MMARPRSTAWDASTAPVEIGSMTTRTSRLADAPHVATHSTVLDIAFPIEHWTGSGLLLRSASSTESRLPQDRNSPKSERDVRRDRHVPSLCVTSAGSMFVFGCKACPHKKHEEGRALLGYNYPQNNKLLPRVKNARPRRPPHSASSKNRCSECRDTTARFHSMLSAPVVLYL